MKPTGGAIAAGRVESGLPEGWLGSA